MYIEGIYRERQRGCIYIYIYIISLGTCNYALQMADGIFKAHCVFFMTLAYLLRPATRKRPHHEQFEEWGMSPQDWTSTNNQTQKLESTGNKKHATHICTYMYSILHIAVSNRVPTLAINTYVKSSILLCLTMNCLYTYWKNFVNGVTKKPWLYHLHPP